MGQSHSHTPTCPLRPDARAALIAYEPTADIAVLEVAGGLSEEAGSAMLDLFSIGPHAPVAFEVPAELFPVHILNHEGHRVDLEGRRSETWGPSAPDLFLRGEAAAQVSFGTSGGPVWDDAGRVVALVRGGDLSREHPEPEACLVGWTLPVWLAEKIRSQQKGA